MYQYQTDYILQKEQELDQATSEIESLRARAAQDEAEKARHQIKYDDLLRSLEFQVVEVKEHLTNLKEGGEETWEQLKDNVEKAADELKASLRSLGSRLSSQ
jgi:hypothetical protein